MQARLPFSMLVLVPADPADHDEERGADRDEK
jgi:hypothetical protein